MLVYGGDKGQVLQAAYVRFLSNRTCGPEIQSDIYGHMNCSAPTTLYMPAVYVAKQYPAPLPLPHIRLVADPVEPSHAKLGAQSLGRSFQCFHSWQVQ